MTIKRTYDSGNGNVMGLVIELTSEEVYKAYLEKEHEFDTQDVIDMLEYMEDEIFAKHSKTKEQCMEMVDRMAYEKRRNVDKYDMEWECAVLDAISSVLNEK